MDPWMGEHKPQLFMEMIDSTPLTYWRSAIASTVRRRTASRSSQRKTAQAQEAGCYKDEIVRVTTTMVVANKEAGEVSKK